ncbi:MAG: 30S ribosomal protein S1 [bacterium]|nr:30S ribosomal protein S1 [bacterium]
MSESSDTQNVEKLDKQYADDAPSTEFAALLEQSDQETNHKEVSVGERISGTLQNIGDSVAFVDYGGRSEAAIDTQELKNETGTLAYQSGDTLEAYVANTDGEVRLTLSLKASSREILRKAFENKIPIEGKVTGFNTGGLVVNMGGIRGFCPMSQIDTGYCEDPASYATQTLSFMITEIRGSRNLVVSRRAYLEAEAAKKAEEIRKNLKEGAEMTGTVTRIERFGAFVDLGGIEGLVHVSEISHARVENPRSVLQKGQELKVKILALKALGSQNERISLSMKALEADPWDALEEQFKQGDVINGKVVSIQNFGAFVELIPGIEGLVHISQLSTGKRVATPKDVVSIGQEVKAMIREIDLKKRRVSLSMRALEEEAKQSAEAQDMAAFKTKQQEHTSNSDGSMADALRRAGLA